MLWVKPEFSQKRLRHVIADSEIVEREQVGVLRMQELAQLAQELKAEGRAFRAARGPTSA